MADQASGRIVERNRVFVANFKSLEEIRNFVGQAARDCGLSNASIYAVEMAVDEACTNIIEHAYQGECTEVIECTCRISEDGLHVQLKDCGTPFDPSNVPEPDVEASLEDRSPGGLGFFFMHKLMDEIFFEFIPGDEQHPGCNELTMIKYKGKER